MRRTTVVRLVGLAVASLVLFGATGCDISKLLGATKTVKVGERATSDVRALTVHSVKVYDALTNSLGLPMKVEGDFWVLADVTVQNLSSSAWTLDSSEVGLFDEKKRLISSLYDWKDSPPADLVQIKTVKLAAGGKKRGMLLMLAPEGETLAELVLEDKKKLVVDLGDLPVKASRPKALPKVGQRAVAGGVQVVVRSVTYPTSFTYPGLLGSTVEQTPKAGYRFVVVEATVRNLRAKPKLTLLAPGIFLFDSSGQVHTNSGTESFLTSGLHVARPFGLGTTSLSPGKTARGQAAYVIPKTRKPDRIRFPVAVVGPPLEVQLR